MKYRHEPLRIPENWRGQDRQFVIQLERLFDDIYSRLGRENEDINENSVAISEVDSDVTNLSNRVSSIYKKYGVAVSNVDTLYDTGAGYTNSATGKPEGTGNGTIIVTDLGSNSSNDRCAHQIYIPYGTANIYSRLKISSSWGDWSSAFDKVATKSMSSTDLNTYRGSADYVELYKGDDISQFSNIPSELVGKAYPFMLEVAKLQYYTKQTLHVFTTSLTNPTTYVRQQTYTTSVTWGSWNLYALSSELAIKATNARTAIPTPTLKDCSGTVTNQMYYHLAGNVLMLEGRLYISGFTRSGPNPGFTFTLPSSKKSSRYFAINGGITYSSAQGAARLNELLQVEGYANNATITIYTTETYTNMNSSDKAWFMVYPIYIDVY